MFQKKKCNGQILPTTQGVCNSSSKNVGLGKFWPDLQNLEVFVIGFEVLFSGDFASWSLNFLKELFETRVLQPQKVLNLPFLYT